MRRWLIPGGIFIVVVVMAATVFFTVGSWLVVEDPLVHADVIVVLSGRLPERAVEAARVYKAGYADQVWISPPVSPVDDLKAMKISYLGEDFYNEKVLIAQGSSSGRHPHSGPAGCEYGGGGPPNCRGSSQSGISTP